MSPPIDAARTDTSYHHSGSSLSDPQLHVPSDELTAQHSKFSGFINRLDELGNENFSLASAKGASPSYKELQDAADFFAKRLKQLEPVLEQLQGMNKRLKDRAEAKK